MQFILFHHGLKSRLSSPLHFLVEILTFFTAPGGMAHNKSIHYPGVSLQTPANVAPRPLGSTRLSFSPFRRLPQPEGFHTIKLPHLKSYHHFSFFLIALYVRIIFLPVFRGTSFKLCLNLPNNVCGKCREITIIFVSPN